MGAEWFTAAMGGAAILYALRRLIGASRHQARREASIVARRAILDRRIARAVSPEGTPPEALSA